nr:F-box domain, leucine-rich repeat domain, L domain-like protein [Tanacetum cinerariifolium]
ILNWTEINAGIQQHLQKVYNTNKAAFKARHWVIDPTTGTYNVENIRRARPENITASEWDKYIEFWNDIGTLPEPLKIGKTGQRARSYLNRDPGRLLAFEMRWQISTTQEYPSLIDTFFMVHSVNGEFLRDEDRHIYEEMRRLKAMGTYTDDEINCLARGGKQRGHIPGVGRVLPARATASSSTPAHESTLNNLHKKVDFMMSLFKSDSTYSDMFLQFESGGASGSGRCGDEEEAADHQADEDEDGDGFGTGLRSFPDDMSPGNMCHRGTYFLTGKMWDPPFRRRLSLGKESLTSVPQRLFPGDKSPGKPIPSDKSPGKAWICRWGRGLML